jgi:hypothetical protein
MSQSTEQVPVRNWSGTAEVVAPTGDVLVEVAAELWERHESGRGPQWGGHLVAPAHVEPPHLPSADDTYSLRLIGAGEALVTTRGTVKMHLFEGVEPTEEVEIIGVGDTPF